MNNKSIGTTILSLLPQGNAYLNASLIFYNVFRIMYECSKINMNKFLFHVSC